MEESERPTDLSPHGYGRAWSEPKATGIARVFQRMREPATKDDWAILCVGVAGIAILAAALL